MAETSRLVGCSNEIDMVFVERERAPELAIALGIQAHIAGLSLSKTDFYSKSPRNTSALRISFVMYEKAVRNERQLDSSRY